MKSKKGGERGGRREEGEGRKESFYAFSAECSCLSVLRRSGASKDGDVRSEIKWEYLIFVYLRKKKRKKGGRILF